MVEFFAEYFALIATVVTLFVLFNAYRVVTAFGRYRAVKGARRTETDKTTEEELEAERVYEARARDLKNDDIRARAALESRAPHASRAELEWFFGEHKRARTEYVKYVHLHGKGPAPNNDPYLKALAQVKLGKVLPPDPYKENEKRLAPTIAAR